MIERRWPVRALCFAQDAALSDWARTIVETSTATVHYVMPRELLAGLSRKDEPSELIAIARIPDDDPERIALADDALVVVLDRPSSPGNLGTIIRSCDALGGDGVVVTGHAVDVYAPEVVAATAGSFFDVPVVRMASAAEVGSWLDGIRESHTALRVVGTSAAADTLLDQVDLCGPTVLVVGNETHGLGQRLRELCEVVARIPMRRQAAATSINVACATTVALYEVARQRAGRGREP
jgi:TrmH family RNA methyltransferase